MNNKHYKEVKIFCTSSMDTDDGSHKEPLFDICHKYISEAWGNGNDSYTPWEVFKDANTEHDECDGMGYLTNEELSLLSNYLLEHGALEGESVLLSHGW